MFWQLFNSWRPGGTQQFEPLSHSLKPAIYGLRTHFDAIDFGFRVFSDFRKRHGAMKKKVCFSTASTLGVHGSSMLLEHLIREAAGCS